jgi:hypothetical protein
MLPLLTTVSSGLFFMPKRGNFSGLLRAACLRYSCVEKWKEVVCLVGETFRGYDGVRFLYGNVILRQICPDEAEGSLILQISCAERGYQTILYHGVYVGQLTANHAGRRILLAQELPLSILNEPCHAQAAEQLFSSWEDVAREFISLLQRMGHRLYLHHLDNREECLVIAREIQIRKE